MPPLQRWPHANRRALLSGAWPCSAGTRMTALTFRRRDVAANTTSTDWIHGGSATPTIPSRIFIQPPELVAQRKKLRSLELALTRKIRACTSWQGLQVLLNSETSFNRIHIHVATVQLAQIIHAKNLLISERTELDSFIRSKLIPLTDYHMLTFRPWELSSIAWALAMLGYTPPSVWITEWSGSVSRRLDEFTCKDLSQCLRACATFHNLHKQRQHPASSTPQQGHDPHHQRHSSSDPSDLGITHKFLEELSFGIAAKASDFSATGISNCIWAYATLLRSLDALAAGPLGLAIGQLLARASQILAPSAARIEDGRAAAGSALAAAGTGNSAPEAAFNPQELSIMAWGVAVLKAQVQDSWLRQLGHNLAAMRAPQPRHLARGLWALASLHLHTAPDEAVLHALTTALLPHVRLRRLANVDIAQVTYALGKLRFRPVPELIVGMMDAVGERMASLQPRELAMTLYGLAILGAKPSADWLPRLCCITARRWHLMHPMVAATLLASLARMQVRPCSEFLDVAGGTTAACMQRRRAEAPGAAAAAEAPGAAAAAAPPPHGFSGNAAWGSRTTTALAHRQNVNRASSCMLSSCEPRVLAWTVWSLGAMVWSAPKWWSNAAMDATLRTLPSMAPSNLVRLLLGLAHLCRQRPPQVWSDAVVSRLVQVAPELSTGKLVLAAHALRLLHVSPSSSLRSSFHGYCQRRIQSEAGAGGRQQSASAGHGENGGAEGLALAVSIWLKVAELRRSKCGSLEVWHQRRTARLNKLQQLSA